MTNQSLVSNLLKYLYNQREQIESTGYRIDPDLCKAHEWVNEEIQTLQMMIHQNLYEDFKSNLQNTLESPQKTDAV